MLVLVIALLASQPGSSTGAKPPSKTEDGQRVKCHVEEVTGTLAGQRRVCHTVAEWQAIADRAVEKTNDLQDKGLIQPTNGH